MALVGQVALHFHPAPSSQQVPQHQVVQGGLGGWRQDNCMQSRTASSQPVKGYMCRREGRHLVLCTVWATYCTVCAVYYWMALIISPPFLCSVFIHSTVGRAIANIDFVATVMGV